MRPRIAVARVFSAARGSSLGGGHTWPAATGALGASETIWQFLSAHRSG